MALIALNVADLVTTRIVVAHIPNAESNPLAAILLPGFRVDVIKFYVLFILVIVAHHTRPTVSWLCALWAAVGFYFLTVTTNLLVLRAVA